MHPLSMTHHQEALRHRSPSDWRLHLLVTVPLNLLEVRPSAVRLEVVRQAAQLPWESNRSSMGLMLAKVASSRLLALHEPSTLRTHEGLVRTRMSVAGSTASLAHLQARALLRRLQLLQALMLVDSLLWFLAPLDRWRQAPQARSRLCLFLIHSGQEFLQFCEAIILLQDRFLARPVATSVRLAATKPP